MKRAFAAYLVMVIFGVGILLLNFFTAIALSRGEADVAVIFATAQIALYIGGIVVHSIIVINAVRAYERARGRCYQGRCAELADDALCDWE